MPPPGLHDNSNYTNVIDGKTFVEFFVKFRGWCNVEEFHAQCDKTLNAPPPNVVKTDDGYEISRPAKYCYAGYKTREMYFEHGLNQ